VTSAEAGQWTGNILILFDSRQTSEKALLAELQTPIEIIPAVARPRMPTALFTAPAKQDAQPAHLAAPEVYVTGTWGRVYKALGWSSVGMAFVGAATPGIPTVPFALLAGYFFVRSSPAANAWLHRSQWFGPMLRDWEEHGGVTRSVKVTAFALMGAGLVFTLLAGLPTAVVASIVTLEAIGVAVVVSLPVVERPVASEPLPG
jgi:uncharacterized membrane protein YbaN (DUF454 family)